MFVLLFAAVGLLAATLVAGPLLVVWLIAKHPILSVPIAIYIGLAVWLGAHDAQALCSYALIALVIWRLAHKHSFQRLAGRRLRSSWQRLRAYDRRWHTTMVLSDLARPDRRRQPVPKIRTVQSTPAGDRVLIDLVAGQRTEDIECVAPTLTHGFGAHACGVIEDRPRPIVAAARGQRPAHRPHTRLPSSSTWQPAGGRLSVHRARALR